MKDYKEWTAQQRWNNLSLFKRAVAMGLILSPAKCCVCGQEKGILQTHCTDYTISLTLLPRLIDGTISDEDKEKLTNVLRPMCWQCHQMTHKKENHPKSYAAYIDNIARGVKYPPVYSNDWSRINNLIID